MIGGVHTHDFIRNCESGAAIALPVDEHMGREESIFYLTKEGKLLSDNGDQLHIATFSNAHVEATITTREMHGQWVESAVEAIRRGELQKVVVSRYIQVPVTSAINIAEIFERLKNRYPTACIFYINHPEHGRWIGATPELLLKYSANKYSTIALAGTQRFVAGREPVWSNKFIQEQQLVTDDIREKLIEAGAEDIRIEATRNVQAGPLVHLRSDISFRSRQRPSEWAGILHPTSAVCGMPKEKARSFILQHEGHSRGLYTGMFGIEKTNGEALYYVALRCMQINSNSFGLYVGGGITGESQPEDEWQETEDKSRVLLDILE